MGGSTSGAFGVGNGVFLVGKQFLIKIRLLISRYTTEIVGYC